MLTRRWFLPAYSATQPPLILKPGVVRMEERKGVTETWAVSRPTASPVPDNGPLYLGTYFRQYAPSNVIHRSPSLELALPQNRVEMDPSNSRTWQRSYLFPV
jgi:hypothetical protein